MPCFKRRLSQLPDVMRVKKRFRSDANVGFIDKDFAKIQNQIRNESVDFLRHEAGFDQSRAAYIKRHQRRLRRSRQETSKPVRELQSYFRMLNQCKSMEEAFRILESLKASGIEIHMMFFTKMMKLCAELCAVNWCCKVLDEIESLGLVPDLPVLSTALAAGHKARDLPATLAIWQRMADAHIQPDQICYSVIIAACAELPRKEQSHAFPKNRQRLAESLFSEMTRREISPDHMTYAALLNVYAKAGLGEKAEELFNDLKNNQAIFKDAFIYSSLMTAFKSTHPEKAIKYFEEAKELGLANMPVYTSAMGSYQNMGEYEKVLKLWEEMFTLGFSKSDVSLSVYFRALARVGSIAQLMDAMWREKTFANHLVLCNTIHELYYYNRIDCAVQLFAQGYKLGVFPLLVENNGCELDFHSHLSGIACSAVRYFLAERVRKSNAQELSIIVGRGIHSGTKTNTSIGTAVRKLLDELGIGYEERNYGGNIIIPTREIQKYIEGASV